MTHASAAGSPLQVDAALVRLSVGIESEADLVADLAQALERSDTQSDGPCSKYVRSSSSSACEVRK